MSNAGKPFRSAVVEPVIGDEFDLETYGRPSAQRTAGRAHVDAPAPGTARARRINSHAPRRAETAPRERNRYDANGRRTVKISGQATPPRRRSAAQIVRYDQHPDRAAQWALFLGVFMVVVAIVTGS